MRALAASILSLGLAVSPVMASNAAPGDKDSAATSNPTSSNAATQPASFARSNNARSDKMSLSPASDSVPSQLRIRRYVVLHLQLVEHIKIGVQFIVLFECL